MSNDYSDPRRLFRLFKELTGEDLTPDALKEKTEIKKPL